MGDAFGIFFAIIWIIVVISIFSKAVGRSRQNSGNPNPQQPRPPAPVQQRIDNVSSPAAQNSSSRPTFRDVPGSTYGTTRNTPRLGAGTSASQNSGYGQGAFAPTNTSGKIRTSNRKDTVKKTGFGPTQVSHITDNPVLFEDRRNDWLAKQLREEAAIKRRGSIYDLGASHDVNCDAESARLFHAKRHNTNGLNKQMFR